MRPSRGNPNTLTGSARGFTLLEIVIVLVLGALLMAGAIGYLVFSGSERHLRNSSGDIEILAKRARTIAMLQQTPYALVIAGDGVHLMPLAEALEEAQTPAAKKAQKKGGEEPPVVEGSRYTPIHADWTPEEDDKLFVKRWASDNWLPADDRTSHVWRFDPDGICEPVTLRLQTGANYIETEYHPLTAAVRYTTLEASK
jgi:prepilin-type N-terminal cleavage/methylation domain-containing protein